MWFKAKKTRIYLDYASATPVCTEALNATVTAMTEFGNPGAIHAEGVQSKARLTQSREGIAHILGCKSREVIFVSGGSEANNLAILGFARTIVLKNDSLKHTHWIVSSIEHPSVLECFGEIERLGGSVTFVEPDTRGIIRPDAVGRALKKNTVFVSIAWANHEIGSIQPLRDIVRTVREHNPDIVVHTDASQAPAYIAPHVHTLDVDLMSLDSGKLYGPRGIGALYVSSRAELHRVIFGGGQERGLRAGTENVALAAGFAEALSVISRERDAERRRLETLRNAMIAKLEKSIPHLVINGEPDRALPHILNISIPDISSEYVTLALDHAGIAISTKSACREGEESRSHVVQALIDAGTRIGNDTWRAQNTLRFSFGRDTDEQSVQRACEVLFDILARIKT